MKKWPYLLVLALPLFSCATKAPSNQQGPVKLVFDATVGHDGRPRDISVVSADGPEGSIEAGTQAGMADIRNWNFGPERAGTSVRVPFLYSPRKPVVEGQAF